MFMNNAGLELKGYFLHIFVSMIYDIDEKDIQERG